MAMTTTPPVTVVSLGLSSVSSVTVAPSLTGFPVTLDQHGVVQPPPLMPRGSGGVIGSVCPHTFIYPIHLYAPAVYTPICPHTPLCICMFSEASAHGGGL